MRIKKILAAVSALLFCLSPFAAFSASAAGGTVFVSDNNGSNANDGLSAAKAKKSLGSTTGDGSIGVIPKGGTLVVCEKLYFGSAYTWALGGSAVITAVHGGTDYRNAEPASNPSSGVIKMKSGVTVTVASNLTLRNVILFQEHETNTFVVSSGVTFTVDESVTTMSANGDYMRIIAAPGSTVVVNGGTFESVSGEGTIRLGSKAVVLYDAPPDSDQPETDRARRVCWIDPESGSDSAAGTNAASAVKTLDNGVFKRLLVGGTAVVCGPLSVPASGAVYNLPLLPKPLTFTSVYQGADYKSKARFRIAPGGAMVISSDVIFDDIVLLAEGTTPGVIRVKAGATLTVTDRAELVTNGRAHYRIELEKGAYALLSENARQAFTVSGEGAVLPYTADSEELIALLFGDEPIILTPVDGTTAAESAGGTTNAAGTTGASTGGGTGTAAPADGTEKTTPADGTAEPETGKNGESVPASSPVGTGEAIPGGETRQSRGVAALIGGAVASAIAACGVFFFLRKKAKPAKEPEKEKTDESSDH
ncbi:MAG: hypothetical protein IJR89_09090 [Clostridia bacterium]|nr:hypothetical protein [Clostridia bacterium]